MDLFSQKIKEYKNDILLLILLLSVFVFQCSIFFAHQPNPLFDVGTEGYIPMQMLKGQVLYKDIFTGFAPLAFQLNSCLFAVFGASVNTLYCAGIFNSLLILFTIYFIARNLATPGTSAAITFAALCFAFFTYHMSNYLYPYSYNMVYALSAFLLSALFFIRYLKTSAPAWVILSSFFISLSIMFKYEFIPFLPLLVYTSVFYRPIPRKYIIYCLIAGTIVPFFSFLALFLQGVTLNDLVMILVLVKKYSTSSTVTYFYTQHVGIYPSITFLIADIVSFVITVCNLLLAMLLIYGFIFLLNKIPAQKSWFKIVKYSLIVPFIIFFPRKLFLNVFPDTSFCWLPLFTLVLFFVSLAIYLKNKTKNNEIFCFVALVALAGACKSLFLLNVRCYGIFFMPLLILVNIIFFIEYFPDFFKFIDKKIWKTSFLILIVSVSTLYSLNQLDTLLQKLTYPIKSDRGTIYTSRDYGEPMSKTIEYINRNIPEDKSFLMIPGSLNLNFLTGRDSINRYYDLGPAHIETFGEQNIINDFKKNPPDYIFLNNANLEVFGKKYLCLDYGYKICGFVLNNYNYVTAYGDKDFQISIFKKR